MKRNLLTTLIATAIITTGSLSVSSSAFASTEILVTSATEIQDAILENMRNRETNFTIHYQGADATVVSKLEGIIDTVTAPSTDEYLNLSFTEFNPKLTGTNTDFVMVVTATYLTTKEQEQYVDDKVAEIMSNIVTPGMNEKQKIQAIHQYIIDNVTYDTTLNERTAYTALYDGKTVCMGYSMLLQKMAQKVGIECHIIKGMSNAGYHAWNKVKVEGTWYNIDATTDDSLDTDAVFMVSDQVLTDNKYVPDKDSPSLPVANTEYVKDTTTIDVPLTVATNAVTKAEGTISQADVDSAQTLVNALPVGADKTNLQNRLNVVQANVATANQARLTTATDAVATAESSKLQSDVDIAKPLVNALVDGTDKTGLLNRLVTVQNVINNQALATATNAVVTAEGSKLQADVDTAKTLVNALVGSTGKTDLQDRLNVVQTAIFTANTNATNQAIADATNAVANAEGSKVQADVDSAKGLVNALPNGTDKTALLNRLTAVQSAIDTATANTANQALTTATNAVVTAEGSKVQADVDSAKTLVNALPNGTDKTTLLNRLNVVQTAIDTANANTGNQAITNATNAVATAEGSKVQADLDSAKTLVNALPNGTDKTALLNRLTVVQTAIDTATANTENQALTTATNAVATAEGSKVQADVDSAKTLVNALPNGTDKTALLNRLTVVQTAIDTATANTENQAITTATNAVATAEGSKVQADLDSAKTLVNALPNGTDKTALLNRLTVVQTAINTATANTENQAITTATNAVATAEGSKVQADVDSAKNLVNALPNSTTKTTLLSRLTAVQTAIDNNTNPVETKITGIVINGSSNITSKDGTIQLTASVTPSTATNKDVTWTSSNTNVATVSSSGLITAIADGSVTITAKAKDGSNVSNTKIVTITGQTITTPVTNIKVTGISINGNNSIGSKGGTTQLTAIATPSNASNQTVTWSLSDSNVATIDNSGVITAKTNGTVTITATSKDGSGVSSTKSVTITGQTTDTTVTPDVPNVTDSILNSVSISGTEEVGRTLKAKIKYDGTKPSVEYQWQRASSKNGDYSDINGATDDTYKLKSSDENKYVRLMVTTTINGNTHTVYDTTSRIDKETTNVDNTSTISTPSTDNSSPSSTNNNSGNPSGSTQSYYSDQDKARPSMPGMTTTTFTGNGQFVNPSGRAVSGWMPSGGSWYYLDSNGVAKTGWVNDKGNWYYLDPNVGYTRASMKTGWIKDNGKWYYLNSSGAMLANTTIDGYRIGADGAWI